MIVFLVGSTVENEGLKCLAYERVDVLLAVPYGFVADKFGRKPVLLLGIVGVILSDIWVMAVCMPLWSPLVIRNIDC